MEVDAQIQSQLDIEETWKAYAETKDERLREKIVLYYVPLVKYVVARLFTHLPNHVSKDDLLNTGIIGLIKAVERYDPSRANKFDTYAVHRVRGAILDELRSYDLMPRRLRMRAREVQNAIKSLEGELVRYPTDIEIAEKLQLQIDDYYDLIKELSPIRFFPLSDVLNEEGEWKVYKEIKNLPGLDDAQNSAERQEIKQALVKSIQDLPKQERLVITLYYYEELTMKEIGVVLKVSESRVSQIHTHAIFRLRNVVESL